MPQEWKALIGFVQSTHGGMLPRSFVGEPGKVNENQSPSEKEERINTGKAGTKRSLQYRKMKLLLRYFVKCNHQCAKA